MTSRILTAIQGGGLPPWPEATEKMPRETLETLLKDFEQILIIGIRRAPEHTGNTEIESCYVWREGRTCVNELIGSVHRVINTLGREVDGDDDE